MLQCITFHFVKQNCHSVNNKYTTNVTMSQYIHTRILAHTHMHTYTPCNDTHLHSYTTMTCILFFFKSIRVTQICHTYTSISLQFKCCGWNDTIANWENSPYYKATKQFPASCKCPGNTTANCVKSTLNSQTIWNSVRYIYKINICTMIAYVNSTLVHGASIYIIIIVSTL